ncbi:MAG: zinc ribbon domain-containing protein [Anaerolineae bacterium]|jgi:putative FmdB family regulatory protein
MPIYEYECSECGLYFEKLQKFGDPAPETCPNGHPRVHRLLSQPTIIFKGKGFYITDNGRSSRTAAAKNGQPSKEAKDASNAKDDAAGSSKAEKKTGSKAQEK